MSIESTKKLTILMINEHSLSTNLDYHGFRKVGFKTLIASSLSEAKNHLLGSSIDIVLINREYKRVSSQEVAEVLRSNVNEDNKPKTKIVLTSCFSDISEEGLSEEVFDLFVKLPVPRISLLEKIKDLIGNPQRLHERHLKRHVGIEEVRLHMGKRWHELCLVNISISGMSLLTKDDFIKGGKGEVEFFLPGDSKAIKAVMRVSRVKELGGNSDQSFSYEIGGKFECFESGSKERLNKFLKTYASEEKILSYYL